MFSSSTMVTAGRVTGKVVFTLLPLLLLVGQMTLAGCTTAPQGSARPTPVAAAQRVDQTSSEESSKPTAPLDVSLSFRSAPALGKESTLVLAVTPLRRDEPNTELTLLLPEGLQLVSGVSAWRGAIRQGERKELVVQVRVVRPGKWVVRGIANIVNPGTTILASDSLLALEVTPDWTRIGGGPPRTPTIADVTVDARILDPSITPTIVTDRREIARLVSPPIEARTSLLLQSEPLLGQESTLALVVRPLRADATRMALEITLPEGLQLVSGDTTWTGAIKRGEEKQLAVQVRVVRPGTWIVIGRATSTGANGTVLFRKDASLVVGVTQGSVSAPETVTPGPSVTSRETATPAVQAKPALTPTPTISSSVPK